MGWKEVIAGGALLGAAAYVLPQQGVRASDVAQDGIPSRASSVYVANSDNGTTDYRYPDVPSHSDADRIKFCDQKAAEYRAQGEEPVDCRFGHDGAWRTLRTYEGS